MSRYIFIKCLNDTQIIKDIDDEQMNIKGSRFSNNNQRKIDFMIAKIKIKILLLAKIS